jgi:hypothetical protein
VQKLEQILSQLYQKHIQDQDYLGFADFQIIFNELGRFGQISKEQDQFEVELLTTQLWLMLVGYDLKEKYVPRNKNTSLVHILFCPYSLKFQEIVALLDHAFPNLEESRARYV